MYGSLLQLTGDLEAKGTWQRIPVSPRGTGAAFDEAALQKLLFRHVQALPLQEIDPAYADAVPVCTELGTSAGFADALYLSPSGRIILAEFKLWKNPEARREVVAQILDYARVLATWGYDDLQQAVLSRTGQTPFRIVSDAHNYIQEPVFIDRVVSRLRRGKFLLLIIGDGIREDVEEIVAHVQDHSGLRFNLALIEAAVFRRSGTKDVIIQPRVLARTKNLERTIFVDVPARRDPSDDEEIVTEITPYQEACEQFWTAVLHDLAFGDKLAKVPSPAVDATIYVGIEGSGHGGWGMSFGAFVDRDRSRIGTYLMYRSDQPECKRVFDSIVEDLEADNELFSVLKGWTDWSPVRKRPRLGFIRRTEFVDGTRIRDFDQAAKWMHEHFNRLVTTLHPVCRRRLRVSS